MAHYDNSKADPKEVQNSREMWASFTDLMKWAIMSVVIILIGMAVFLL